MTGLFLAGDFEILELVRRGASGSIYRARQRSLDREVALVLLDAGAGDEGVRQEFLARGRRWATLNHPNVIKVHQLGSHEGTPFIVTEPLSGHVLEGGAGDPAPAMRQRLQVMIDVARGLSALHAAGFVHGNLSPGSILVDGGVVKIFDVGLPRGVGQISFESEEQWGVRTADYLSPEQIHDLGATPPTDVFSFGVMLYEVLAGVHPFQAEHPMAAVLRVLHDVPEAPSARAKDIPEPLSDLAMHCMQKDPARRPQSMVEVEHRLVGIAQSHALSAESPAPTADPLPGGRGINPYGNAVMIRRREDFFGRGQDVRWIYARLNSDPPGSVSVVGDRKVGKSSLLNYIYMQTNRARHLREPEKLVMVFINLQGLDLTIESFSSTLLRMTAVELRERLDVSDCPSSLDGLRTMVERVHSAGYRLVIILDEFECVTSNPGFPVTFFSFLRFLVTMHDVAYVTSSVRDLQTLCHDDSIRDSPFFNVFSARRLGGFLPEEARELIQRPSQRVGQPLEPYTEQILDLAGPFPFYLQVACSLAMDALQQGRRPDFTEIRRLFETEVQPHFRDLWEGFEEPERDVLALVARGRRIPDASQHVLEALVSRQYVRLDGSRAMLFASPFRDFVLRAPRVDVPRQDARRAPVVRDHARTRSPAAARWRFPGLDLRSGLLLGAGVLVVAGLLLGRRESRQSLPERGQPTPRAPGVAAMLPHYRESYALVIGEADYPQWTRLPGVSQDVREVSSVLKDHGFVVETVENKDRQGLEDAFKRFIDRRGRHKDDRLLVYFAGHGYTMPQLYGGEMGYIVPVDAPDPQRDPEGFRATAISMMQVRTYALEMQSKHVLFVFDACFAGTIFTPLRDAPPASIRFNCSKPVRQFITSGAADEKVPDESHFRKWFVTGLRGGADLNADGYVTAHELAGFLRSNVSNDLAGQQNPQYGVLLEASQGDVVFSLSDLRGKPGKRAG